MTWPFCRLSFGKDSFMPNLSQVLKAEIARISRREIKASVTPLKNSGIVLKKNITEIKKRLAILETGTRRLLALQGELQEKKTEARLAGIKDNKVRVTSRSVKALRSKLGFSQDSFAALLGVSGQAVYVMEHKGGRLKLRTPTMTKFLSLRETGKREATRMLEEIHEQTKAPVHPATTKPKGGRRNN